MKGPVVSILVADDHPVVREGLAAMLSRFGDLQVAARAADGLEAMALALRLRPDVVLCDLRMPGADGIEVSRRLKAELPGTAVLILSTFDDSAGILAALTAGARGYLLKDAPPEEIHRAVVDTVRGGTVLHPVAADKVARVRQDAGAAEPLTGREIEVLALLAGGLANKEIAARLRLGESTVKTHLANVFRKLGASDRVQAVTEGMRRGYLEPPRGG